jgi:hypothetical protein
VKQLLEVTTQSGTPAMKARARKLLKNFWLNQIFRPHLHPTVLETASWGRGQFAETAFIDTSAMRRVSF